MSAKNGDGTPINSPEHSSLSREMEMSDLIGEKKGEERNLGYMLKLFRFVLMAMVLS